MTSVARLITARDRLLYLALGVMITLCITGYTFGQSNHHVYLLDALRIRHPETLARDWFTSNTLQYHVLYTRLVLGLQTLHALEAGFFVLYLALVIAMHTAWFSINQRVGGDGRTYLLSVLFYHLSAGGLGLGVYQFLQDGSFLPSNISSIATLVALACWLDRKFIAMSAAVGIAGLFHVNYALLMIGFWGLLSLRATYLRERMPTGKYILGSVIAMSPSLFNAGVAALSALKQTEHMPMSDFYALYVHLRHEHHHDPLRWPTALWISFLWTIPLAFVALRRMTASPTLHRVRFVFVVVLAIELFAFIFAGIWFVSDTLVLLSFFRFSIFAKLISCLLAAWLIVRYAKPVHIALVLGAIAVALLVAIPLRSRLPDSIPAPTVGALLGGSVACVWIAALLLDHLRPAIQMSLAVLAMPVVITFAAMQRLGVEMPGESDPDMVALCAWARTATPPSSLFLTPPQDAIFGLDAQRSSVVGFKQVPQLSGELVAWRRRLEDVLDMNILALPTPMPRTLSAMATRYAELSESHLRTTASHYDCDYVIAMRRFGDTEPAYVSPAGRYFVYRVK